MNLPIYSQTIQVPASAYAALMERVADCPYQTDDDWGVVEFTNAVDEHNSIGGAVGGCDACPRRWGPSWVDVWIPRDKWRAISPNGDDAGHLCFDCITSALDSLGYADVPVELWGGPWKQGGPVIDWAAVDPEVTA